MRSLFQAVAAASAPAAAGAELGALPQWRLDDLYESMDSPRFAADLQRAQGEAKAFAERWRGKLAAILAAADAGDTLAGAVRDYEALQDLVGRVMSYASLLYASDTSDSARAKFYGDAQERVTALAGDLLFFELELNRLDDAALDKAMAAPALGPLPAVARGHPQGEAAPASPTPSSNCSWRSRCRARPPGTACSTTRCRPCASISKAKA